MKNIAPYVVSILGSIITYVQAKKKLNQELEIVKTNNEHEINRLVEEHKINIEDLERKHKLEMEAKEKEYEHEKEILELKSRTSINEKSQEAMNTAMSGVMGNIFNGKIIWSRSKYNKLSFARSI